MNPKKQYGNIFWLRGMDAKIIKLININSDKAKHIEEYCSEFMEIVNSNDKVVF